MTPTPKGEPGITDERLAELIAEFSAHPPYDTANALRELAAMRREWQPIETAPRDGRRLLLATCIGGGLVSVGSGEYSTDPYRTKDDNVIGAEEGFRRDGDQCIPSNQECFTHWMPLPAAPKVGEGT